MDERPHNGSNGHLRYDPKYHGPDGRFKAGNPGGPGGCGPNFSHVQRFRAAFCRTLTPEDVEAVVRKLVELAVGGNMDAIREVLDRAVGKQPLQIELGEDGIRVLVIPPPVIGRAVIEPGGDAP